QPPGQDPQQGEQGVEEGMEPQTRGPVHEAFAAPTDSTPRPTPIVPKQPPDPVEEMPPDQKPEGTNVQWVAGYWAWDEDTHDFLGISGSWRDGPPDRVWTPGYWAQADGGWQWVAGYWAVATQAEAAAEIEYLPPPPPSIEAGPSAPPPDANSIYVPGSWI